MSELVSISKTVRQKIVDRQTDEKNEKASKKSKKTVETPKKPDPLFDNEMIRKARETMSPEDRAKYDQIGKDLYETINFETGEVDNAVDALAQLRAMIQSGLHPSFLAYEERQFLEHYLGKEWYQEFGYLENDIKRINL